MSTKNTKTNVEALASAESSIEFESSVETTKPQVVSAKAAEADCPCSNYSVCR